LRDETPNTVTKTERAATVRLTAPKSRNRLRDEAPNTVKSLPGPRRTVTMPGFASTNNVVLTTSGHNVEFCTFFGQKTCRIRHSSPNPRNEPLFSRLQRYAGWLAGRIRSGLGRNLESLAGHDGISRPGAPGAQRVELPAGTRQVTSRVAKRHHACRAHRRSQRACIGGA